MPPTTSPPTLFKESPTAGLVLLALVRRTHTPPHTAHTMAPTLYIDLMSQPSRACYILIKKFQLPVDIQMVRLDKGEHKQAAYLSINPLGKVPFLTDGDMRLPESAAIMAYLAALYNLPQQWHPPTSSSSGSDGTYGSSDGSKAVLQRRALFDAAVNWWHLNVRRGCMTYAFFTIIGPRTFNVPASPQVAAHGLQVLKLALKDLESYWLDGGRRPFMTGQQVSVPDLLCCCELEQLTMMVASPAHPQLEQLLQPHPAVRAWMQRVREALGPQYEEGHSKLRAAVKRLAAEGGGGGGASKL